MVKLHINNYKIGNSTEFFHTFIPYKILVIQIKASLCVILKFHTNFLRVT